MAEGASPASGVRPGSRCEAEASPRYSTPPRARRAVPAHRRGSHSLERLGEALDAAVSFVQAFLYLLWAKRTVCYVVLIRVVRLILFVLILLPGWIPGTIHYFRGQGVRRGARYGPSSRHKLDLYLPDPSHNPPPPEGYPTVMFVCGGAWIIGYRMWAFLFGWGLQRNGVLCAAIDYRNWPQATIPEMVDDVELALRWVHRHAAELGGDTKGRVTIVGQSAGAHLTALLVLQLVLDADKSTSSEESDSVINKVIRWIGVSGPYDLHMCAQEMDRNGLDRRIVVSMAEGELAACSPMCVLQDAAVAMAKSPSVARSIPRSSFDTIVGPISNGNHSSQAPTRERVIETECLAAMEDAQELCAAAAAHDVMTLDEKAPSKSPHPNLVRLTPQRPGDVDNRLSGVTPAGRWPRISLYHGRADKTVSWRHSEVFSRLLHACGAPNVSLTVYEGKSHTDPILEDPLSGNDQLLRSLLGLLRSDISVDEMQSSMKRSENDLSPASPSPHKQPAPEQIKRRRGCRGAEPRLLPRVVPSCLVELARLSNPF